MKDYLTPKERLASNRRKLKYALLTLSGVISIGLVAWSFIAAQVDPLERAGTYIQRQGDDRP